MPIQQTEASSSVKQRSDLDQCIENCLDCYRHCELALANSYKQELVSESDHLILLSSCAEICRTSAKFMLLGSPFHAETCSVCSNVCLACAESCEDMDDDSLKACIQACRKCAESCAEMSSINH